MAYVTTALLIGAAIAAAASAAQGVSSIQAAHKQQAADQSAYNQNVAVAHQNAITAETATNQNEVQAEQKAVQANSQREMRADQALGTLRVQGSNASTSQGSYNALMEQGAYSEGSDLNLIQTQYGNTIQSAEEDKAQDKTDYNNQVAAQGTQLQSEVNRASAASTSALIGSIGSGLSIASNYENGVTKSQASTDAYNQNLTNLSTRRTVQ